ncbi:MAG: TRAFAC clade GTPase domain-containing protein [Sciscionella sp.]
MPYLFAILLAIIAVVFALYILAWLVMASFLWLVLPALLIVVPVAVLLGAVMAAVIAALTLAGQRSSRPETITPDRVASGTARLPKLRGDNPFGRDRAWPSYFAAQGRVDLEKVWTATAAKARKGWRWIGDVLDGSPMSWVPVLLFACPFWLGFSAGAFATAAVIVAVCGLALFAIWVPWGVASGFLRAGDQLVRSLRKASGSCPRCYHVTSLPAFACDGCGRLHRDIRPGRLGGAWRRCGCGTVLPTTVLRVARRIPAQCPRCTERLRAGAAVVTDIRLPVFGPVSAGKTRLVYAGLLALRDGVAANGGTLDFVDEESQQAFDNGAAVISTDADTVKTSAGELPHAITARFTAARRRALLHLFDAAGEFYADREDNSDLEFLDHAQGLVFVVDPFSVPWVRDQLGKVDASSLVARANPASEDPERVYHVTTKRLRDYGVNTRKRKLAMTVVKADLLTGLPLAEGLSPEHGREWLIQAGLDNLVLSAERDFGEVRYFVVASKSGVPAGDGFSPANPLRWLAAGAGLEMLPAQRVENEPREAEETV